MFQCAWSWQTAQCDECTAPQRPQSMSASWLNQDSPGASALRCHGLLPSLLTSSAGRTPPIRGCDGSWVAHFPFLSGALAQRSSPRGRSYRTGVGQHAVSRGSFLAQSRQLRFLRGIIPAGPASAAPMRPRAWKRKASSLRSTSRLHSPPARPANMVRPTVLDSICRAQFLFIWHDMLTAIVMERFAW